MKLAFEGWNWQPPAGWTRITSVDMHTGGEPLRVFMSGLPPIEGRTVLEKVRYFREHYDYIRSGTMWEPRGHADMYGAVVTASLDADFDVFFLHNEGYSTMCGHAIIALTKLVIEGGLIAGPAVMFNVPAGRIEARGRVENGIVVETTFRNVPSFVLLRARHVSVAGLGEVRGELPLQCPITVESILGSTMTVRAAGVTRLGPHDAVIPEVSGSAHFTDRNEFWFDPGDPLRGGFIFR